jgi:peptide/nickel transport system substrate-binding protein
VGYAADRDYVVSTLMNDCGVATALPVHPSSSLYDEQYARLFQFSPEKASLMFQTAGVSDYDNDGKLEMLVTGIVVELNIRFIVNSDSTAKVLAARRICEQLNAIGITTTLYELTWADYIESLEKGEFDMYYGEIRMTPDWNLSELFRPRENRSKDTSFVGMNYARTRDTSYLALYERFLGEADNATRYQDFQDIAHYIAETGIILPVCFERRELLTHRGVATGISATQYDVFHNFNEWTITM